jgi:hypothetical protein
MKDIVMTDKISGTPCTIIQTAYAKQIGLKSELVRTEIGHQQTHEEILQTVRAAARYETPWKMRCSLLPTRPVVRRTVGRNDR